MQGVLNLGEAERRAVEHADQLVDIAGWDSFEVYSTRRQMLRYLEWYSQLAGDYLTPLVGICEQIFNRFPSEVEERY